MHPLGKGGTGFRVIFKNNNGEVLAAAAKLLPSIFQPHISEAMAFCWAIETAHTLLPSSIFETDC